MLKKLGIGCGGLLGLMILFVVGIAIIGGGESPETASDSEDGSSESAGSVDSGSGEDEDGGPSGQVGETLEVGEAEWMVTNAEPTNTLQSEFGDTRQGDFVVVEFDFTNNTGEAVTLDSTTITLVDGEGREFDASSDTFSFIPQDRDLFLTQVNPGVTQPGTAIFTIAPDAQDFQLEVGGAGFFSSDSGTIELGF